MLEKEMQKGAEATTMSTGTELKKVEGQEAVVLTSEPVIKLSGKVRTQVYQGHPEAILQILEDYEAGIKLLPITNPEIPDRLVVINDSPHVLVDGKPVYYEVVSNRYRVLKSSDAIRQIIQAIEASGKNLNDLQVTAVIGRSVAVRFYTKDGEHVLTYINSYDRKVAENVVIGPFVPFAWRHTRVGEAKRDFSAITKVLSDEAKLSEWKEKLSRIEVNKNEVTKLLGDSVRLVVTMFFGVKVDHPSQVEPGDWKRMFWDEYTRHYGTTLGGFVRFANDYTRHLYSKDRRANSFRVARWIDTASRFVRRKLKPKKAE